MSNEVVVKPSRFASSLKRCANLNKSGDHGLAAAVRKQTAALTEARFRDGLAGPLNHAMLTEALSHRVEVKPDGLALLAVSLQQVEVSRESHSQEVADTAFKAIAQRLGNRVRAADVLARISEHALVLLLRQVPKQDQAAAMAKRVLGDLSAPIHGWRALRSTSMWALASVCIQKVAIMRSRSSTMLKPRYSGRSRPGRQCAFISAPSMLNLRSD